MNFIDTPYYQVGKASDLQGSDRVLYRLFEMLPGLLAWTTILGTFFLSFFFPFYSAFFIIAFNLYWVLKSLYLAIHLRQNWKRLHYSLSLDWMRMLESIKYEHIVHLVVLPFYTEGQDIIEANIEALKNARGDTKKMFVVLAAEERAGAEAQTLAKEMHKKYAEFFGAFLITTHPSDVVGEIKGKGSNTTYALEIARKELLDAKNIPYKDVLLSVFDSDTIVYKDYFLCLTWHFLTAPNPYRVSFQPVPLYNNNMWQAPALSRLVATSGSFWQMIQQERPERLTTFSSHSIPFQTIYELGYWQKNVVSEDSRIYWNALLAFDGKYEVIPLSYPVSMDANLAGSFWQTMKNVYKQQCRWSYGVENIPYMLMGFVKNKNISIWKKISVASVQLERTWSLATNPLLLFLFMWLPILIGGRDFNTSVLSHNLPIVSRYLTVLGLLSLVFSAIVSLSFLPTPPNNSKKNKKIYIFFQWIFIPFTLVVFGAIPSLDAQTRLMLGKYMGFWVTPKHRKTE